MQHKGPIFLFAFANDPEAKLRLGDEQNACWNELEEIHELGKLECRPLGFATLEQIFRQFNRSKDRIYLFHFGGHSGKDSLHLEGTEGSAINLGAKIAQQKNLKLVFLNGCKNQQQARILLDLGVPVVIATTAKIEDTRAIELATQFYQALAGGSNIGEAFASAKAFMLDKHPSLKSTFRTIVLDEDEETEDFNWGIFYDDSSALDWSIASLPFDKDQEKHLLTELPSLEDEIIGRDADVQRLKETLEQSQRVVLMNGMGGIGKTTTAIAFANQYKEEYRHIAWVEQVEDFVTSLTTNTVLLENLDIQPTDNPEADAQLILNKLANLPGKSLLVIDNADKQVDSFKNFLPKAPNWQVLLTSRQELDFAHQLPLDFLSKEAALELFYTHYSRDENDVLVNELLGTIDYHTLTIELLAKTAQKRRIAPLEKLLDLLKERGLQLGRRLDFSIAHSGEEKIKLLFPYLTVIFQLDEGITDEEIHWLKQFVGLPPVFVSVDLLIQLYQLEEEEIKQDELTSTLELLKEKGWLTYDEEQDAFKMHRIIQEAMKAHLQPAYADLEKLVEGIADLLYIDELKDNPIDKFQYVVYAERILQLFTALEEESFSVFQSNLGLVFKDLGRYEEAMVLLEKALASDMRNFGTDNSSVSISQSNLALVYQDLGHYEEAADLLEKALASAERNFEANHFSLARFQSNLAIVYQDLGRYEESAGLLEKALASNERNFGLDHPSVAGSQSNLALLYKDLGRYEESADLLEKALASNERSLGLDHPNVAISQSNLAMVYQDLGRYYEAAKLHEKALASNERNFGANHPSVAGSQSNLAIVYQDLGRYEAAAGLLEKALASNERNFGLDHPSVARSQSNLAITYRHLGRYDEAAKLHEKALASNERNFGLDHPSVARSQSNLALVYQDLGRYEAAAGLLEKALASDTLNFGLDHPYVSIRQSNLATVYQNLGHYEAAAALLEKALASDERNFGSDHPNVSRSQSNLALVYQDLGRYEEAISYYINALKIFIAALGEAHPNVNTVWGNLVSAVNQGVKAGDEYCINMQKKLGLDKNEESQG